MKINYNVSAGIANKNLLRIEDKLSTSMERLSSGLKINRSKDNPAGMAISNKMQAQIDGLNRASQNASDGISVIQIAEGALAETTQILQRMRELSVQAASDGTMSLADRQAIQDEVESLKEEIDRISTDTEYNSKSLLNGTLDTRVYANNASRINISDYVKAGSYELTMKGAATQAEVKTTGKDYTTATAVGQAGTIAINGSKVEISSTDTLAQAFEKIRDAAELGEATASLGTSGVLELTSNTYGQSGVLAITFDNDDLATALGFTRSNLVLNPDTNVHEYKPGTGTVRNFPTGADAKVELNTTASTGFSNTATVAVSGNRVTITDNGGFSLSFLAEAGYDETLTGVDGKVIFDVTDIGTMTLHIGANESQDMEVRIPEVSCKSLYIDDLDVTTVNGGSRAITSLDAAIAQTTSVRSKLGAYENRLEYSTGSLDTFEENMTGALARITDVDMAEEMTNYTHQNVLNQAAISVLTQANDLPQQVLQILQ